VTEGDDARRVAQHTSSRTSRGERTRTRLVSAARDVLAARGYAATRVEDVVAAAGVSHGTFYTYFENKPALLEALIDDAATELQAVVDSPWEGPDGSSTIAAVIGRFVGVFSEQADVVRVWLEASAHDEHFRRRLQAVRLGYVDRVAAVLGDTLAGTSHEPRVVAAALVAMVEGVVTQDVVGPGDARGDGRTHPRVPAGAVVRTLTGLWLGGVVRLAEDPALP
jgi:AcrR family transcriptional regulator